MGIYLNPGNSNFTEISGNPYYVDKTEMLSVMNQFMEEGNKYVCISRPRRFGKTIAGEMICAYYSKGCDSKNLFCERNIAGTEGYEKKLNKYNVIKIDMNSEFQSASDKGRLIETLTKEIKKEFVDSYPEVDFEEEDSLPRMILRVYAATGESFIIIIDEYDVLVREQVDGKIFAEYLSLLNGLFKSATLRPAISLAYLTGILPIVRDKVQSKLNNFEEYSFLDAAELSEFVGFTSEEVEALCLKYGTEYGKCHRWYNGYSQNGYEIYNPQSVIKAVKTGKFKNYWSMTSSYQAISDRIQSNFRGMKEDVIRMLSGEKIDVNVSHFLNTMDSFTDKSDVFTFLIHLGYLAYDPNDGTCRIPNREIRGEWYNAIMENEEYATTNRIIEESKDLLEATLGGNEEMVAKALDRSHIHVTSNRSYNNEDALASAIYLAYIYALNEYTVIKEVTTGKGFADVVYIPLDKTKEALVIELKRNKTVESGIAQIKERRYFESMQHYKGNLLLVGISYDEEAKTHSCVIERMADW